MGSGFVSLGWGGVIANMHVSCLPQEPPWANDPAALAAELRLRRQQAAERRRAQQWHPGDWHYREPAAVAAREQLKDARREIRQERQAGVQQQQSCSGGAFTS